MPYSTSKVLKKQTSSGFAYEELARTAREALRRGELDTGSPEVRPD
jgi:hypothetical protein